MGKGGVVRSCDFFHKKKLDGGGVTWQKVQQRAGSLSGISFIDCIAPAITLSPGCTLTYNFGPAESFDNQALLDASDYHAVDTHHVRQGLTVGDHAADGTDALVEEVELSVESPSAPSAVWEDTAYDEVSRTQLKELWQHGRLGEPEAGGTPGAVLGGKYRGRQDSPASGNNTGSSQTIPVNTYVRLTHTSIGFWSKNPWRVRCCIYHPRRGGAGVATAPCLRSA